MQTLAIDTPDGRRLELATGGADDGPLLVWHHGTPGSRLIDPGLDAGARAAGMRLAMASRPGYGGSTRRPGRTVADAAADTAALLDALGATSAVVVGHSGGGPHALACAALLPGRVRGCLTLAGVGPFGADGLDFLDGMGQDNLDEFGVALEGEAALRAWLVPVADDVLAAGPARFGELLRSVVSDVDLAALEGGLDEALYGQLVEGLAGGVDGWLDDDLAFTRPWGFEIGQIACPVHVWQGPHDLMVPAAHGAWLAAHVPGAVHRYRPDDGHLTLAGSSLPDVLADARALAG